MADQATRWRTLLDALAQRSTLSVAEAVELLGASPATVRRDFAELARRQLASRTHGGITATSLAYELPARYRTSVGEARERIAAEAASRVRIGSTIAFNGGTTVTAAARLLGQRPDVLAAPDHSTTIVTNALNIASDMVLRPSVRTVLIGGEARIQSFELVGPFAHRVLDGLLIEEVFLGVDSFGLEGASCRHLGEAQINAQMCAQSSRVTVLAAAPKLATVSLAKIVELERVDELITDTDADESLVEDFRGKGLTVTLV